MQLLVAVWRLASSPKEQLGEEKEMASSCVRADLDWILEKNIFSEGVIKPRNRLPWAVVESSSLEGFKRCLGGAPGDL